MVICDDLYPRLTTISCLLCNLPGEGVGDTVDGGQSGMSMK